MTKVTFVKPDGSYETFEGEPGQSVMQLAKAQGIVEIVAECGGACMCATCHCIVAEESANSVGGPHETEDELLEMTAVPRAPTSRLSCQISIDELDGDIVVHLPDQQR